MTTKGPKKPAPPARAPRPSASRPGRATPKARASKPAAPKASAKKATTRRPKATLKPAVDASILERDPDLPKLFGGGPPSSRRPPDSDAEVTRVEKGTARRTPASPSRRNDTDTIEVEVPVVSKRAPIHAPEAEPEPDSEPPESEGPVSRRAELVSELDVEAAANAPAARRSRRADPTPPPAVVAQIRELEAQLDRLIDEASRRDLASLVDDDDEDDDVEEDIDDMEVTREKLPPEMQRPTPWTSTPTAESSSAAPSEPEVAPTPRRSESAIEPPRESRTGEKAVFDTARELLSTDFYLRKWGRLAMRGRSEEVDDFGFDPIYDQKVRGVLEFLYTRYFRVEQTGIERVPTRGRCLLVANHSGTLPLDGVMIKTAVKLEHPAARDVRWLSEDFIYHMPFLGSTMNRLGSVRACQENAERLLAKEQLVAVFPEGVKGIGKLFAERYRLQRFGRGGFIKLCLRTQTPIIPVAVVGAEETNPMLFRIEYFAKALGVPYVPVTPTFPLLGPAGLLPAPTKWQMHFGEPIDFSAHGPDAADDEILVAKLAERVRATIQGMLDRAVGTRKSIFFG